MARNTAAAVVLLLLVVVQLASIVPPTAAAGRALASQLNLDTDHVGIAGNEAVTVDSAAGDSQMLATVDFRAAYSP
jgi:hypothetical protein